MLDDQQRVQFTRQLEELKRQLLESEAAPEDGECFVCGELIALKRLQFDPTQVRCIDCSETTDT